MLVIRQTLVLLACLTVPLAAPGLQTEGKRGKEVGDYSIAVAEGTVVTVDKNTLTIQPRSVRGKEQKEITLILIPTSHISLVSPQRVGENVLLTQREGKVKDLAPGQVIAVVYTTVDRDAKPVLLTAVTTRVPSK